MFKIGDDVVRIDNSLAPDGEVMKRWFVHYDYTNAQGAFAKISGQKTTIADAERTATRHRGQPGNANVTIQEVTFGQA